jgi:hypothetical protein
MSIRCVRECNIKKKGNVSNYYEIKSDLQKLLIAFVYLIIFYFLFFYELALEMFMNVNHAENALMVVSHDIKDL